VDFGTFGATAKAGALAKQVARRHFEAALGFDQLKQIQVFIRIHKVSITHQIYTMLHVYAVQYYNPTSNAE
jgi:hypothetical protein